MVLKEVSKERLMRDMIHAVQPKSGWKVLIVDKITLRVISSCARMYDIMEQGVTLVESIEKPRQPLPNVEAIYFLSPSPASVDALVRDYAKKPQYGDVHLFFSTHLPQTLFDKIKVGNVCDRIRTFKELNLEFLAAEAGVFSLDRGFEGFYNIYSPNTQDGMAELRLTAVQLATAMVTLRENPYIRYASAKPVCAKISQMVAEEIRELRAKVPDYAQSCREQRATLIIIDRSSDALAPLLHEFTTQAMAMDLLDVRNGEQFTYKFTNNKGEPQENDVLLNENDKLWPSLRHMHIASAIDFVIDGFNEFARNNKAAALSKGNVASLQEMSEAVRAMPEYRELLSKYSLHIYLTQQCMDAFNARGLQTIAEHEQNLAMGEDSDGNKLKNAITQITPVLSSASVDPLDKLRLVMIYIITNEGIKDADRQVLMRMAGINTADQTAIANLHYLGVNLTKGKKKKSSRKKDKQQRRADDVPSYLSRYQPMVKTILEDALDGRLPADAFPYATDAPTGAAAGGSGAGGDAGAGAGKSLRQVRPKWAGGRSKNKDDDAHGAGAGSSSAAAGGPARLILFVIGGATYSETRSAAECAQAAGREVIIGSTDLITPAKFIQWLRDLKQTSAGGF
jgi:syntaxin-binding protein 1